MGRRVLPRSEFVPLVRCDSFELLVREDGPADSPTELHEILGVKMGHRAGRRAPTQGCLQRVDGWNLEHTPKNDTRRRFFVFQHAVSALLEVEDLRLKL